MRISLNWVKEFTEIDISTDELLQKIGAQLGAVEEVIDFGQKYDGALVAKVVVANAHPDADKLKVCLIDDGGSHTDIERNADGLIQVVCGAPNVALGQTVAWLPPGATVPCTVGKQPLVLEARDIRGQVSNGMLASPKELGLSDDHDGILVFDEPSAPGTPLAKALKFDDTIIGVENKMFTHRPDCFGTLGLAREIAGICGKKFTSPDWYQKVTRSLVFPATNRLPIVIDNQVPELCQRLLLVSLRNIKVGKSPLWLQSYLCRMGLRPINNLVDITNYVMYLTGQPLHAYDYDKVKGANTDALVAVRLSGENEQLKLINGKLTTIKPGSLVIANGSGVIGLAGVMGGLDTEVDEHTQNAILECGSFSMYAIRRSSMGNGVFSDAVTRFNKGPSPKVSDRSFSKAIELMQSLSSAEPAGSIQEAAHYNTEPVTVSVSTDFVNDLTGLQLNTTEMTSLLGNVEFGAQSNNDTTIYSVPDWRTDIEIPEDIAEEVARLYGFDHIPLKLPVRTINPATVGHLLKSKQQLRELLSSAGASEALTYSFVHANLLQKAGQNPGKAFKLNNAISPDLHYYRLSLTPSLLSLVHPNIKAGINEFALFELNKSHIKGQMDIGEREVPAEFNRLCLIYASKNKTDGAAYFSARAYLDYLAQKLKLQFDYVPVVDPSGLASALDGELKAPYDPNRSAVVICQNKAVGLVGEYSSITSQNLKLPAQTAGFELDSQLLSGLASTAPTYNKISKYPKITQDLTLQSSVDKAYAQIKSLLDGKIAEISEPSIQITCQPLDIYQDETAQQKSFTFRLTASSDVKTMKTDELSQIIDRLAEAAAGIGAQRI